MGMLSIDVGVLIKTMAWSRAMLSTRPVVTICSPTWRKPAFYHSRGRGAAPAEDQPALPAHVGQSQDSQELRERRRIIWPVVIGARKKLIQRRVYFPVLCVVVVVVVVVVAAAAGGLTAALECAAEVLDDQPAARPQRLCQAGHDVAALR